MTDPETDKTAEELELLRKVEQWAIDELIEDYADDLPKSEEEEKP